MKGICGYWNLDGQPSDTDTPMRMADALRRNGAGHSSSWHDGSVALAQATWSPRGQATERSSVFRDPASGCVVIADARLDERAELIAALESPRDTEGDDAGLILQAWLRWGEYCPERLYGDFVFALWDPRRSVLYCARDAMGTRPLYVHHVPGRLFAFASSCDAMLALPHVPRALDEGRIADFLVNQLEGVDKTSTFFSAIQRLPPAHCLAISQGGARQRRYWALQPWPAATLPQGDDAWADALTEAMERAVGHHLVGPEPVGCMLSGGLDSSSLAIIARDQLAARGDGPLPTFSAIDSSLGACRETGAIRAMLALPGFAPSVADCAAMDAMLPALTQALLDAEEPFDGGMTLLHAQYITAAQRGIGAVIDGIDADTLLLAGAALIRQLRRGRWLAAWHNARGFDRIYFAEAKGLPSIVTAARSALLPRPLRRAIHARRHARMIQRNIASSLIAPQFARRIDLGGRLAALSAHRSPHPHSSSVDEAIEALDHPYTTVGLERYHRVAARHGIEARHPFTDRHLVELCAQLPDRQRLRDGWSKPVLRHAMRTRLPEQVCWRGDKHHLGWSMTQALMANQREETGRRLQAMRDRLAPYLDLAKLDAQAERYMADGNEDAAPYVFDALRLGGWLARYR